MTISTIFYYSLKKKKSKLNILQWHVIYYLPDFTTTDHFLLNQSQRAPFIRVIEHLVYFISLKAPLFVNWGLLIEVL